MQYNVAMLSTLQEIPQYTVERSKIKITRSNEAQNKCGIKINDACMDSIMESDWDNKEVAGFPRSLCLYLFPRLRNDLLCV